MTTVIEKEKIENTHVLLRLEVKKLLNILVHITACQNQVGQKDLMIYITYIHSFQKKNMKVERF